jgi:hypothetical protein
MNKGVVGREPRSANRMAKDLRKEIDTYLQAFTLASLQQFDNPSVSNQTYRARAPRMLCYDFPFYPFMTAHRLWACVSLRNAVKELVMLESSPLCVDSLPKPWPTFKEISLSFLRVAMFPK